MCAHTQCLSVQLNSLLLSSAFDRHTVSDWSLRVTGSTLSLLPSFLSLLLSIYGDFLDTVACRVRCSYNRHSMHYFNALAQSEQCTRALYIQHKKYHSKCALLDSGKRSMRAGPPSLRIKKFSVLRTRNVTVFAHELHAALSERQCVTTRGLLNLIDTFRFGNTHTHPRHRSLPLLSHSWLI